MWKWRCFKFMLLSYLEVKVCEEKNNVGVSLGQNHTIRSKFADLVFVSYVYNCKLNVCNALFCQGEKKVLQFLADNLQLVLVAFV